MWKKHPACGGTAVWSMHVMFLEIINGVRFGVGKTNLPAVFEGRKSWVRARLLQVSVGAAPKPEPDGGPAAGSLWDLSRVLF